MLEMFVTAGEQGLPLLWQESCLEATIADPLTLGVTSVTAFVSPPSTVFMNEETVLLGPLLKRWNRWGRYYRHSFLFPVAMPYGRHWRFTGATEGILSVQSSYHAIRMKLV